MICLKSKIYLTSLIICFFGLFASSQDIMYIRLKNGELKAYSINSIDSISLKHPSNIMGSTVKDFDNNEYHTVRFGDQIWMVENLRTTHFRNGDLIPTTSSDTVDISGEAEPTYQWPYCINKKELTNYGRFYTWCAITDKRQLAPEGWHVATGMDWYLLKSFISNNGFYPDGSSIGYGIVKWLSSTTDWKGSVINYTPGYNPENNNGSGFNALPTGYRAADGKFVEQNISAIWMVGGGTFEDLTSFTKLSYDNYELMSYLDSVTLAAPVRCVKNVEAKNKPTVTTSYSDIKPYSAYITVHVTTDGLSTIYEKGYCWDTVSDPTIESNKVYLRGNTTFTDTMKNLITNKYYYIKGYAINSKGLAYGNEISFMIPDTAANWVDYATGTFKSTHFDSTWVQTLQFSSNKKLYRFKDLYAKGYNLQFKWDGAATVTVIGGTFKPATTAYKPAVESGYIDPKYGMLWGIYNGTNTYDVTNKTFTFPVTWRVSAGSFGVANEVFTITDYL